MKRVFGAFALLAVCCLAVGPASSQERVVTVYFDQNWTQRTIDCPGAGVGTLYVVAENLDMFMAAIEFKIDYPPCMTWIADLDLPSVTLGTSPQGITIGFPLPQNAFAPFQVMRVLVMWNCTDCDLTNQRVSVVAHPAFGRVSVVRYPYFELFEARGRTSTVCQHVDLDIKPGSCPNAFNVKLFDFAAGEKPNKGGVLPVAVLGSETFDVADIDLSTLRLEGVAPLTKGGPKIVDVAAPTVGGGECFCTTDGPDGHPDIMMRFLSQDIARAIAPGYEGDRELTLTGNYLDGIPFEAKDCIRIVGHTPTPFEYSGEPVLNGAFPNPFNPVTRLTYFVPERQHVRLAVYDVTGRLAAKLVDGMVEAGEHAVEWRADGLASGVYFGRMETGNTTQVTRLILLK